MNDATSKKSRKKAGGRPDWVAHRIHERRTTLGLTLSQLAKKAQVRAPSYIFHIENGERVPSEAVAVRLARALEDDVELYRAWALARNRADLSTVFRAASTLKRLLDDMAPGATTPDPSPGPHGPPAIEPRRSLAIAATEAHSLAEAPGAPAMFRVPVFAEGADPGVGSRPESPALETLRLDAQLLPPAERVRHPFAYRLTTHGARRVSDLVRPGDYAVISRDPEVPDRDRVYAVRVGPRVEISRLWWDGTTLHLLPPPGETEVDAVPAAGRDRVLELVVGRLVVTIRRWV